MPAPATALPLECRGIGVSIITVLSTLPKGAATLFLWEAGTVAAFWLGLCIASCRKFISSFRPLQGMGCFSLSAEGVLVLVASFVEVIPETSAAWLPYNILFSIFSKALDELLFDLFLMFFEMRCFIESMAASLVTLSKVALFTILLAWLQEVDLALGKEAGSKFAFKLTSFLPIQINKMLEC